MEDKKTIGIFFGSRSPEHDVSIITGQLIISGLKELGHTVVPVYIGKKGEWFISEVLGTLEFFKDKNFKNKLSKYGGWSLDLEKSQGQIIFRKKGLGKKEVVIDIAFPAFHGANGEDGTIQGLFELCNIPYVGCDVPSSAVAIDKILTKLFYKEKNILTTGFIQIIHNDWRENKNDLLNTASEIGFPLFVKPARVGSSIGITKVTNEKDLEFAIEVALHYDTKVIVERGVENMIDLTCSVIGLHNLEASLVQESVYSEGMFSYVDKYITDGGAQFGDAENSTIIPARIDKTTTKLVQQISIEIFRSLGCSGISRIDFLYDSKAKKLYANEVNTLPGTLYHHLWRKSGLKFSDLLKRLLKYAEEEHRERNMVKGTFDSEILSKANTTKLSTKLNNKE